MKPRLGKELTPQEAMRLLADNGGPVGGFAFWDASSRAPIIEELTGVSYNSYPFRCIGAVWQHCAPILPDPIPQEKLDALRLLFPSWAGVAMDGDGEAWVWEQKPSCTPYYAIPALYRVWSLGDDSRIHGARIPTLDNYLPHDQWRESWIPLQEEGD